FLFTRLSNLFAIIQQSPDEKTFKKYKNIQERSSDIEKTVIQNSYSEIIHSHSYDFDEAGVHQRKIVKSKIKEIKEDYTKISQPTKEKKNPLILTEICQATNDDLSNFKLKLYIKYTASHHFYDKNQEIEDYILIDTHLGPTLPILLKGIIDPD
ncbi:uncharacterized protein LOC129920713, partial [Episyrphus balteatus]|uniref:uncharacterized protein LOC129920713 n=1 Tax=Episyrphus balteatus TaxID=286459 RepID=UPI002485859D